MVTKEKLLFPVEVEIRDGKVVSATNPQISDLQVAWDKAAKERAIGSQGLASEDFLTCEPGEVPKGHRLGLNAEIRRLRQYAFENNLDFEFGEIDAQNRLGIRLKVRK